MRSSIIARPLSQLAGGAAAHSSSLRWLQEAATTPRKPESKPWRWSPFIPGVRTGQEFRVSLKFDPQRLVTYLGLSAAFEESKSEPTPELSESPEVRCNKELVSTLDLDLDLDDDLSESPYRPKPASEPVSEPSPRPIPAPESISATGPAPQPELDIASVSPKQPDPPGARWHLRTRYRDQGILDVLDNASNPPLRCGCVYFRRRRWKTSTQLLKAPGPPEELEDPDNVDVFMTDAPCAQHTKRPAQVNRWESTINKYYLINRKIWDADVSIPPDHNKGTENVTQRVQLVVDKVRAFQRAPEAQVCVESEPADDDVELFSGLFAELSLRVPMDNFRTLNDARKFSRTRMRSIIRRNRHLLLPNERRGEVDSEDLEWNHYYRHSHRSYRSVREPWVLASWKEP